MSPPPGVSYLGEYVPGETPEELKVSGRLSWIARHSTNHQAHYRLRFGVPQTGRVVQVPFPPQNLRAFDESHNVYPVRWFPRMQLRPQWPLEGVVHFSEANAVVTTYHIGPAPDAVKPVVRRPFFYPVIGPDGVGLTELGKPHDPTGSHAHHYSLWIAHADVAGHDFWSERGGIIAHDGFELMEDGPLFCRLRQKTRWLREQVEILRERRTWTLYERGAGFRLLDLDLEFSAPGNEPVILGKTTFGFLAVRVAQLMTVFDGGGQILNARGALNERQAHLQRAEWIDQSGPISPDRWGGIAMFDHPENMNHPTAWHCRNDGWVGASFNMEKPCTIEPGKPLHLRYRLHLHSHAAAQAKVAERYAEYIAQPKIYLGTARAITE